MIKDNYSRSQQNFRPHLVEKYNTLTDIILSMLSRPFERPTCAEVLGDLVNFQLTNQRVKEYERFETMRKNLIENVEEDSIILDYLSKLDEHEQRFPPIIGILLRTFQNMSVNKDLAIANDDEDDFDQEKDDEEKLDLVEALKDPIASMLNPNNGLFVILEHLSKLDEQVQILPPNIKDFLKTFQNNGVKQQRAIAEDDQGTTVEDKKEEDKLSEVLKNSIASLFNPNNEVVKHFLTFFDQVRDLPENIEKAQERFKNKK